MEKDFGKEVTNILPVQSMHEELNSVLRKNRHHIVVINENGHLQRLQAAIDHLDQSFTSYDEIEILTKQNLLSQMIYQTADNPVFDHEPHTEVLGAGDTASNYKFSLEDGVVDISSMTKDLGATVIRVDFQNRRRES